MQEVLAALGEAWCFFLCSLTYFHCILNFRLVHIRQFCRRDKLSHQSYVFFSRSEITCQLARGFRPLSGGKTPLQEGLLLSEGVKYQNCTIAPRSYHHRERSLNSILLMPIDSTSGQRSRVVSSPETSLEAFLKLRKRQVCEKRCELHFDSQGCLQICRVGLNGSCWECWVERGQFVQVHICPECE